MKPIGIVVLLLGLAGMSQAIPTAAQKKEITMTGSHVHLGVRDLPAALTWLDTVWHLRPTLATDRMATLPFGGLTIILETSATDTAATVGFDSKNCDDDFRTVVSRGAIALEPPTDRPWGARSAYVQGPGSLRFEIEQLLAR